ncbi:MAG TPA: hypothetical protein VLG44_00220, partial [Chlamydiales bacterium]|nr:hypothetical protein [Chlamydiales bacterium]
MASASIVQSSPRQEHISSTQSTEAPQAAAPASLGHRCVPRAAHRRVQAITRDLLGTYNRINAQYYAKKEENTLQKAMQALPDQKQAEKILRKLGVYLVGNLKAELLRGDLAKAKAALAETKIDMDALEQAIAAMHPEGSQALPDEPKARAIVNSLRVFWSGGLKEAILEGDFVKALYALDSSRKDIRRLEEAINALHPKTPSTQRDPLKALIAVQSLGAFFVGELQEALEAGNLPHALLALERMRNDIAQLQEAMRAVRPHVSGLAADMAKADLI